MLYQVVMYDTLARTLHNYNPAVGEWASARRLSDQAQNLHPSYEIVVVVGRTREELQTTLDCLYQGEALPDGLSMVRPDIPDADRLRMEAEMGPGGDHDPLPYHYQLPHQDTLRAPWLHLLRRVQEGSLGGPDDGAEEEEETSDDGA